MEPMIYQQIPQRIQTSPLGYYHTIRVNRDIGEPDEWVQEIQTIESTTERDVIHIKINSCGGRLDTTLELMSAINQSGAHVITEIVGECASAATFLFLCGDEFVVNSNVEMMLHTASFGSYGKENNVFERAEFSRKKLHSLVKTTYEGFLTEEEVELMLNGRDFYFDSDEIINRLEKRHEHFADKIKEEDEQEAPLDRETAEEMTKEELIELLFGDDEAEFDEVPDKEESQDMLEVVKEKFPCVKDLYFDVESLQFGFVIKDDVVLYEDSYASSYDILLLTDNIEKNFIEMLRELCYDFDIEYSKSHNRKKLAAKIKEVVEPMCEFLKELNEDFESGETD